jgi:hypothetical protein
MRLLLAAARYFSEWLNGCEVLDRDFFTPEFSRDRLLCPQRGASAHSTRGLIFGSGCRKTRRAGKKERKNEEQTRKKEKRKQNGEERKTKTTTRSDLAVLCRHLLWCVFW